MKSQKKEVMKSFYQIYEYNKQEDKIGKFVALIKGRSAKEALSKFKKISKIRGIAVLDYGIRFLLPITRGGFYYY